MSLSSQQIQASLDALAGIEPAFARGLESIAGPIDVSRRGRRDWGTVVRVDHGAASPPQMLRIVSSFRATVRREQSSRCAISSFV